MVTARGDERRRHRARLRDRLSPGFTSEDVDSTLADGAFGMAEETGRMVNQAAQRGVGRGYRPRRAVGSVLNRAQAGRLALSILAAADRLDLPAPCTSPSAPTSCTCIRPASGAAIGETSLPRLPHLHRASWRTSAAAASISTWARRSCSRRSSSRRSRWCATVGLRGDRPTRSTWISSQHYRPLTNVVSRPTQQGGRGMHLTGHHEVMFPSLCAALREEMEHS